jgi:hypothetical protein
VQLRRWVSNASATFNTRRRDRAHRVPVRARCPHTHAGGTPAHPCGQDARAPALYGERPARCCGAGYRTLARRSTPGVGIVRIVRPCERDARAPMRAGRPRTHASGTPAHPCGQDARAPLQAGRPRTHAGRGCPSRPMRAGRPRTRAARSSIMLNCAVCDVLFGWRVAPGASCTDTEGCAVSEHRRLRRYSVVSGAPAKRSATRKVMSGRQAKAT